MLNECLHLQTKDVFYTVPVKVFFLFTSSLVDGDRSLLSSDNGLASRGDSQCLQVKTDNGYPGHDFLCGLISNLIHENDEKDTRLL